MLKLAVQTCFLLLAYMIYDTDGWIWVNIVSADFILQNFRLNVLIMCLKSFKLDLTTN